MQKCFDYAAKYEGMKNRNRQGYEMEIKKYNCYDDIIVAFQEPYPSEIHSSVGTFKSGGIVNPYEPTVCKKGMIGTKYPTTVGNNGGHTREYQTWSNMIKRCYDEKARNKNRTYIDVTVCDEWMFFENFYEWYHSQENFDAIIQLDHGVDKDILIKGNKEYAPDKCVLVPKRINNLFLKSNSIRGNLPIGIYAIRNGARYVAACNGRVDHQYLGCYLTVEEAFNVYKKYKENRIKEIAEEEYRKGTITKRCYEALLNYKVEITD